MTNMTEDDTFDALRRTPIISLLSLMSDAEPKILLNHKLYTSFLKKHGWDVEEYSLAYHDLILGSYK